MSVNLKVSPSLDSPPLRSEQMVHFDYNLPGAVAVVLKACVTLAAMKHTIDFKGSKFGYFYKTAKAQPYSASLW